MPPKENNDYLYCYLKYEKIICDLLVDLEEKMQLASQLKS